MDVYEPTRVVQEDALSAGGPSGGAEYMGSGVEYYVHRLGR